MLQTGLQRLWVYENENGKGRKGEACKFTMPWLGHITTSRWGLYSESESTLETSGCNKMSIVKPCKTNTQTEC